tara:strand:+ start:1229 stop:1432 length:204 start_codon:yes stop_codon:yes gene_type:complete
VIFYRRLNKVSNREYLDDEMDYATDDSDSDDLRFYSKKTGKLDVRRGIEDYFEHKRQRDDDNYLFDA